MLVFYRYEPQQLDAGRVTCLTGGGPAPAVDSEEPVMSPLNVNMSRRDRALTVVNGTLGGLLDRAVEAFAPLGPLCTRLATALRNWGQLLAVLLRGLRLDHALRAQYHAANLRRGTVSHRYRMGVTKVTYTWESIRLSLMAEEMGSTRFAHGLTS